MDNRNVYSIFAGILPPLLGLGLIELYVEREVSIVTIVAALVGLGILMIVISALVDLADAGSTGAVRRRRRSR